MDPKFTVFALMLANVVDLGIGIVTNRSAELVDLLFTDAGSMGYLSNPNKCSSRLHGSLEKLRKRQANLKSTGFIDLSGYALHQTLRHLPLDMYITDIRVRTPGIGDWVRIEKCQFSNRDNRMTTQILFNDLTVSGTVQLLDDNEIRKNSHPIPREFCKMSLRFQRAGLGINAFPTKARSTGLDVRTEARFLDPKFLSVHAYGCKLNEIFKRDLADEQSEGSTAGLPYIASMARSATAANEQAEGVVRIITLNPELRTTEESSVWFNLHNEHESDLNEFHRYRLLGTRLHMPSEREKLKAILHVKKLIAEQANHAFQMQGPFSQVPPLFTPNKGTQPRPQTVGGSSIVSTITELDENLSPIRPVHQKPFEALLTNAGGQHFQSYYEVISREMEDIFLRGIKTLLTRYVEKQLEIPLKEALMVNIGYTVSYG